MSSRRSTDGVLRIVLIVLAIGILAPMLMMVFAFPMMGVGGGMMGGYGYGYSPWWSIGVMLVWLAVLVGVGYLVYRWIRRSGGVVSDPALEELRLAYARGDLTEEEFEERRTRLDGG
ncbi:MAG: SHOCT domain-containing protein [Haloferacaceae archaeon]